MIKINFVLLIIFLISGCVTLDVPYSPSILIEGHGDVIVKNFRYMTSLDRAKNIQANEIELKGPNGHIYMKENIDSIVIDALSKELKFAGYNLSKNSKHEISGDILEYSFTSNNPFGHSYVVTAKIIFMVYENDNTGECLVYKKLYQASESIDMNTIYTSTVYSPLIKIFKSFLVDLKKQELL